MVARFASKEFFLNNIHFQIIIGFIIYYGPKKKSFIILF